MHPLSPDLSKLSDEELHKKRGELYNRRVFAYRMGHSQMIQQLELLLFDYDLEVQRRNQKALEEATEKHNGFDDKIDIS